MNINDLKQHLPDYAKDLKINFANVLDTAQAELKTIPDLGPTVSELLTLVDHAVAYYGGYLVQRSQ